MIQEVTTVEESNAQNLNDTLTPVGGKKKRRKSNRKPTKKGNKKRRPTKKNRTKKSKKGASPWILHVKAYCKKHGVTFPEALKSPGCKQTFKH
jgi:hypothetical protein